MKNMPKQNFLFMCLILLIFSCSKPKDKVLFSSSRNGNSDIFVMDGNGKNIRPLTESSFEEWGPTWISENQISFLRQTKDSILRIEMDLTTRYELTPKHPSNCTLDDKNMLYSGKFEAYTCKKDIFIIDSTKRDTLNITSTLDGTANYPSWGHDGQNILFTSNHSGSNEIYMFALESKELSQLTNSESNNERGDLSPDGTFLVFSSDYFEKGNQDIVLKDLESGTLKNISESSGMELIARFSNDGTQIFYGSNQDGNWEIYLYNLKNETHTRLTTNKAFDGDPRILNIK